MSPLKLMTPWSMGTPGVPEWYPEQGKQHPYVLLLRALSPP